REKKILRAHVRDHDGVGLGRRRGARGWKDRRLDGGGNRCFDRSRVSAQMRFGRLDRRQAAAVEQHEHRADTGGRQSIHVIQDLPCAKRLAQDLEKKYAVPAGFAGRYRTIGTVGADRTRAARSSPAFELYVNKKSCAIIRAMNLERLYKIDRLLKERRSISSDALRETLDVSRATLKRDIADMRDRFNAPIEFDRELGGYRFGEPRVGPLYQLPGLWFSATEIHALLTAPQLLGQLQPGL